MIYSPPPLSLSARLPAAACRLSLNSFYSASAPRLPSHHEIRPIAFCLFRPLLVRRGKCARHLRMSTRQDSVHKCAITSRGLPTALIFSMFYACIYFCMNSIMISECSYRKNDLSVACTFSKAINIKERVVDWVALAPEN